MYLTAIDILSKYPIQAEAFLQEIKPAEFGRIPEHPHERCHDIFFLNTAEHFTLNLSCATTDELLLGAASPYLNAGSDPRLVDSFEAAHSVMLAVLSAPQASPLCAKYVPFYIDVLFKVCWHQHIFCGGHKTNSPSSLFRRIFPRGSFA